MENHLSFVRGIVEAGGRIRQHTVYDHLPSSIVKKADAIVKANEGRVAKAAALWFVLNDKKPGKCASCGELLKYRMWPRLKEERIRYCSCKCAARDPKTLAKRHETNLEKYGHKMPAGNKKVQAKFKAAMLARHGVEWAGQSAELVAKREATIIERFGEDGRKTIITDRAKATNLKRYGVENTSQLREVFEKQQSAFQVREVIVDGKTFRVRGYEPQAIRILCKNGYEAKNILTTAGEGVPSVRWKDGQTNRVYHPDFKVKYKNRWMLIEVKSVYTCGLTGDREKWRVNKEKFKAAHAEGYIIKLMVVHKGKAMMFDDPHTLTIATLRKALGLPLPRYQQP